jgi:hypothetical protein
LDVSNLETNIAISLPADLGITDEQVLQNSAPQPARALFRGGCSQTPGRPAGAISEARMWLMTPTESAAFVALVAAMMTLAVTCVGV